MINKAADVLKLTATEIRSRIAKAAHLIYRAGQAASQSESWKMAWAALAKAVARAQAAAVEVTVEYKLEGILLSAKHGSWAYTFACDQIDRIYKFGDGVVFSAKQLAKINELYNQYR